ncbi:flavoprotein [Corynebacterium auris]|uniref:flavoprotein n=1 Tax=Corynebacterium auris TaxID=44750 RepID=UPI00338D9C6E
MAIPGILFSLRSHYPAISVSPFVTESASRMVTRTVLDHFAGAASHLDIWEEVGSPASNSVPSKHIDLEASFDAFVVAPASLDFMVRFVHYDCSSPFRLALQCTRKPVVLAPCLPPGGIDSVAYLDVVDKLARWDNVSLLPPVPTLSVALSDRSSAGFGDPTRLMDFVLQSLEVTDGGDL